MNVAEVTGNAPAARRAGGKRNVAQKNVKPDVIQPWEVVVAWIVCRCGKEHILKDVEVGRKYIDCRCSNRIEVEEMSFQVPLSLYNPYEIDYQSFLYIASTEPVAVIYDGSVEVGGPGTVIHIDPSRLKPNLDKIRGL